MSKEAFRKAYERVWEYQQLSDLSNAFNALREAILILGTDVYRKR